jgi:GxxExxY protein
MPHDFEILLSRIIEAAIDVHKELWPGFIESVYENAMRVALRSRGIEFEDQKRIRIQYRGVDVGSHRLDLIVHRQIVVELKAVKALEEIFFATLRSYLKATGLHVGLLLNFNAPTLAIKRVVL